MIRMASSEIAASGLVATPRARSGARVLRRLTAPTHGVWFWATLWALAAAVGFVALMPVIFGQEPPVAGSEVVFRLVGVSFATCGLIAWRRRPDSDVGRLMTGAGFGIFVYPVASQVDSAFVLTLATLFASVWTIAFTALILSFVTGGRLVSPVDRVLVAASFFALFVLQFVRILFADYPDNVLVVVRGRLDVFNAIGDVQFVISIAVSIGIVVVIAVRWRQASAPGRRALLPSVAGCLCSVLFSSLLLSYLLTRTIPEWLSWVTNAALLTVPAAFLAGMLRSRLARGGLADLFRELGTLRGEPLQNGLASSLGDPSLVLAYRAPDGFVDVHGRAGRGDRARSGDLAGRARRAGAGDAGLRPAARRRPRDGPGRHGGGRDRARQRTHPRRGGDRAHRAARLARADRRRGRRRATAARAQPPRRRAAAAGRPQPAAAHAASPQRDDPALAEQLAAAGDEISQSLEELRELARGIHPAVLDYGLGPRWSRWPRAPWSRPPSHARATTRSASRSRSPPTSSPARRSPTSPSTRRRPARTCACNAATASR